MKKIVPVVLALALVLCMGIGGTLAYLIDSTNELVNTFTYGDINITLEESTRDYKMVPGNTIEKDPKVTVEAGSEECYLFVEITKNETYDTYLEAYAVADGWTKLEESGNTAVYYREVNAAAADAAFSVLKDNQVKVKIGVTKPMMEEIKNGTTANPTLTFKAYAVQKANVASAEAAWEIANPSAT